MSNTIIVFFPFTFVENDTNFNNNNNDNNFMTTASIP